VSSDESRVVLDLRKRIDEIDRIILVELERAGIIRGYHARRSYTMTPKSIEWAGYAAILSAP